MSRAWAEGDWAFQTLEYYCCICCTAPFRIWKIQLIHCRVLVVTMAVRQDPLSPRVSVIARLLAGYLTWDWCWLANSCKFLVPMLDLSALWQGPVAGSGGTGKCLRFWSSERCSKLTFGQKCLTCEDLKLNLRMELSIAAKTQCVEHLMRLMCDTFLIPDMCDTDTVWPCGILWS